MTGRKYEESKTNLLIPSEDFSNAAWPKHPKLAPGPTNIDWQIMEIGSGWLPVTYKVETPALPGVRIYVETHDDGMKILHAIAKNETSKSTS